MPEGDRSAQPVDRPFRADPAQSYVMAPRYYIDPAIYQREKEAVFYRSWIYAGHVGQLRRPGDYVTCQVADQNVFVIRGKDEKLRAFYNVCMHRAHQLVTGCGSAKVITCPYHAWSYHADGALRSARGTDEVPNFDRSAFSLRAVQVEEYAHFVFVNLDPAAPSLRSRAGNLEAELIRHAPRLGELVLAKRLTFELKANWKNVVDNYLECYHCTPAHPAFVDLVDIKNYRSKTYDIYSSHISPPGRDDNAAYSFAGSSEGTNEFGGFWLWPTLTFNVFPGDANIAILHIIPTGPETTLEHFDVYYRSAEMSQCEQDAIAYFNDVLQVEDIGLVESVQRGLHSRGYRPGRYVTDAARTQLSEHAVHHFHSLVLRTLGDLRDDAPAARRATAAE